MIAVRPMVRSTSSIRHTSSCCVELKLKTGIRKLNDFYSQQSAFRVNNQRSGDSRFFSLAIARELPDCFKDALSHYANISSVNDYFPQGSKVSTVVDMEIARSQHSAYLNALERVVPVVCLPAMEGHPDCCFVEDTAVVINHTAVITRPGHFSRRNEVLPIKEALLSVGIKNLHDMNNFETIHQDPTCDGGDVLFTGDFRHLFVGLSDRTNEAGARILGDIFDFLELIVVPPIVQGGQVLHLKSAITHIDQNTLVAPCGKLGDLLLETLRTSTRGYEVIRIPDILACNVISCNNTLLIQDTDCLESRNKLEEAANKRDMNIIFVDTRELAKKDAGLTCCSILLNI